MKLEPVGYSSFVGDVAARQTSNLHRAASPSKR